MANKTYQVKIESILGGHSPTTHFSSPSQFLCSLGIDPIQPDGVSDIASGLIFPRPVQKFSGSSFEGGSGAAFTPMWIKNTPKLPSTMYVYDTRGSLFSFSTTTFTLSGLGDLNDGGSASGNGAEYYDNYIYFARDTTIARYGPLNGTPAFTDDYWASTLGKTALTDTPYPYDNTIGVELPNHIMHRHSDGKLYIADVVDNKGTIHYISTTKTSVEGDTDNGSTYNKVQVGFGLWPTCIESYGNNIVVGFVETSATPKSAQQKAKVAFWDTTSQNVNQITWVEFPDGMITALKNINGVLYATSGPQGSQGFRVSRYVGGSTFETVFMSEVGNPPLPGAVDGESHRLLFGSMTTTPEQAPCVYALGLKKWNVSDGLFNVLRATGSQYASVTALALRPSNSFVFDEMIVGWSEGINSTYLAGLDRSDVNTIAYDNAASVWWSQMFNVGSRFKITRIRIPFVSQISANMILTASIYTSDSNGNTYTLQTINSTNYQNKLSATFRADSSGKTILGENNFWLELRWTGSALCVVNLPITIEYELIDD